MDVILSTSSKCVKSDILPTFESLGQVIKNALYSSYKHRLILIFDSKGYGVILYSTDLRQFDLNNTMLSVSGIKGRAYVQIGYVRNI